MSRRSVPGTGGDDIRRRTETGLARAMTTRIVFCEICATRDDSSVLSPWSSNSPFMTWSDDRIYCPRFGFVTIDFRQCPTLLDVLSTATFDEATKVGWI